MKSERMRSERGRFAEGNSGGPGRPRRETEIEYLRALTAACPPTAWGEIVGRAVKDAQAGYAKAREWLAGYLIGRPEAHAPALGKLDRLESDRELFQFL